MASKQLRVVSGEFRYSTDMKQQKKVLYILTKSSLGGAQKYVYDLATAMQKAGWKTAVAVGDGGPLVTTLQDAGVTVFPVAGFQRDIHLRNEVRAVRDLAHIVRTYTPDVVHTNSSKAGLLGTLVARWYNVPKIIFTAHGWPFHEKRNVFWRIVAWLGSYVTTLLAHHTIVVSTYDRRTAHMPFVRDKLSVIHPGISVPNFKEKTMAQNFLFKEEEVLRHGTDHWVLTLAELIPNKNIGLALDAIEEYNRTENQKIFYSIIGVGDLTDQLQKRVVASPHLREQVRFLGSIPEAAQYFTGFDLFLLTSKKEGFPYVLTEAGMAGLPVIATNVGGISDSIADETLGQLLKDPTAHELAATLQKILADSHKMNQYGNNLKARVTKHFTLDTMVRETLARYTTDI